MFMPADAGIPGVVKFLIAVASGIGGLWFCHVLIVASLILALIKTIDKNGKFEAVCEKSNIFVAACLYILMFGAAQILNIPMIATYRMAYFPLAFLLGYYVFTSEKLLAQLLDFENPFTRYMNKAGWGIYINHITILIVFNYLIRGFAAALPVWVIYALELVVALAAGLCKVGERRNNSRY